MTDSEIKIESEKIFPEAVALRRKIHENPEIGNGEYMTTALIKDYLIKNGIECYSVLDTGVVGILNKDKGEKTIALRADIDALSVKEMTGLSFSSKNEGLMHACGHDIHTASLLGAAKILAEHKDELNGTVKFFFEPDEEGFGGARRMIEKGVMENPKVDKVFGIHIRPEIPAGNVAVKYGKSYAASDIFEITINGKSSHGAEPEMGIDAIVIASQIVTACQTLVSRKLSPTDSAVVSFGSFNAGTACNIIAGQAKLSGIIRTLGKETRERFKKEYCSLVNGISESMGATAEIKLIESYPGVTNSQNETAFVEKNARELFDSNNVTVLSSVTMTTEDFGFFLDKADGCFYHIGCGSEYPLHNDRFCPDEKAILTAIEMHVKTVTEYLNS